MIFYLALHSYENSFALESLQQKDLEIRFTTFGRLVTLIVNISWDIDMSPVDSNHPFAKNRNLHVCDFEGQWTCQGHLKTIILDSGAIKSLDYNGKNTQPTTDNFMLREI